MELWRDVAQPDKHTIFVYGNAGGAMDTYIEYGFWERTKEFLTNHNNVRVICFYKNGKEKMIWETPLLVSMPNLETSCSSN